MDITPVVKKYFADTVTPVGLYLNVRDKYSYAFLMESNDSRSQENSNSLIGFSPLASFKLSNGIAVIKEEGREDIKVAMEKPGEMNRHLNDFLNRFSSAKIDHDFAVNGIIGHSNFDAIRYMDTLEVPADKRTIDIPDVHYIFFRYLITINHYREEMAIVENVPQGESSRIDQVEKMLFAGRPILHSFQKDGEEESNLTDDEYRELVTLGKKHCHRGDVFQIVLSRQFKQSFRGDDFQVYRVLRSINPSPYLFYFNCGGYRIFGSSPETQLIINKGVARLNPIAGTYKRTGDDDQDAQNALELLKDPKENAEHIMLVDLARNDLGKHSDEVVVEELKNIQYFSHVIHLVSTVEGKLKENTNPFTVFSDSFPAGTLSGAPKYKAIELIHKYEKTNRSYYGGAIGFVDLNGNTNHAILIRSFLSIKNHLYMQAGAGIVAESNEENELQEVNNKLGALKKAIDMATNGFF